MLLYTLKHTVPHTMLPVIYCITMWCMLRTPPRSTRHSAVVWKLTDAAHCPPYCPRLVYSPSTARSAPLSDLQVLLCHAGWCKAMFSVKHQIINFYKHYSNRKGIFRSHRPIQGRTIAHSSFSNLRGICFCKRYLHMHVLRINFTNYCSQYAMFTICVLFCILAQNT